MTVRPIMFLLPAAVLAGCTTMGPAPTGQVANGTFHTADGSAVGTAQVRSARGGLVLHLSVAGLLIGAHGVHLHSVGSCHGPGFTTAAAHLNPAGHQHGTGNPAGSHLGDLPNLVVSNAGTGLLTAELRGNPAELEAQLFDADGTAVVVHAGPDDYRTDPSGNSGLRIACAVLRRG